MKVRARFLVALFLSLLIVPVGNQVIAQSVPLTVPISINTNTVTQLLAAAGRPNQANVVAMGLGVTEGAGVTTEGSIEFVTGTIDGESTPCTTNRTLLTGALTLGSGNTGGLFPVVWGNPVMVIPSSSTLCAITTNGAAWGGWMMIMK